MQHTSSRNPDNCEHSDQPFVSLLTSRSNLSRAQSQDAEDETFEPRRVGSAFDDFRAVEQPDFDDQQQHVQAVDEAKACHCRRLMGGNHNVKCSFRMMQMQQQRHCRAGTETQRGHQSQSSHRLEFVIMKHVVQR